jgi:hypothetical protein
MTTIATLLEELNSRMLEVHTNYERHFWTSYMGDSSVDEEMTAAEERVTAFRADASLSARVEEALAEAVGEEKVYLEQWQRFFTCYQTPPELLPLRKQVADLEADIQKRRGSRTEGYTDPHSGEFVEASRNKMRMMIQTEPDEALRKACFEAVSALARAQAADLIELVRLRNQYAHALGYEDFYAYRLHIGEGMKKEELFAIFDDLYERTKYGFDILREMEKEQPGLRLPWNQSFMLAGDFKKKEDPYLRLGDMVRAWGQSFAALGIGYQGATLQLDLVERKGKYDNGFCHWPELVHFKDGKRVPGASNFTCNAIPGQLGSGARAAVTLFHEGGHAAHLTNVETPQVCMNHEYAPLSMAWAETQSMFLDSMQESPEWLARYATDAVGKPYPMELHRERLEAEYPTQTLRFMSIMAVMQFERELYEADELTEERVLELAKRITAKHTDLAADSWYVLQVPHIYSWESSCYYHSYGLADLAVAQWRAYFYEKYGYIVDNPNVGTEMYALWKDGASKTFPQFVQEATGKSLSVDAFIESVSGTLDEQLEMIKQRIADLEAVPRFFGPVELEATIRMVHGKELIADNSNGFEVMVDRYADWLDSLEPVAA